MNKIISLFVIIIIVIFALYAEAETVDIKVNGLVCDFCARTIEKSFKRTGKVEKVDVNLDKGQVQVVMKTGAQLSDGEITQIVTDAGYNLKSINKK